MAGSKRTHKAVKPVVDADDEGGIDFENSGQDGTEGLDDGASSPSVLDTGEGGDVLSSDSEAASEDDAAPEDELKHVAFGTLARAQDSLSRKRKRGSDGAPQQDAKLDALRARLEEIRQAKGAERKDSSKKNKKPKAEPNSEKKPSSKRPSKQDRDDSDDSDRSEDNPDEADFDKDDDEDEGYSRARSSKHAPTSQSSKWQVTRKRTVIDAPKRHSRDPRFDLPGPVDQTRVEQAYSFLHDYEDKEMGELRAAIKKTKDEGARETLRRKLTSMENRKKTRLDKERRQGVVREHRKKEREAIEQGKKPFYLKEADIRKQALVNKFEGMKSKDRERAMERRRKKESQKEKKSMPAPRRIAG